MIVHHHYHHNRVHLRAVTQIRRMRLQPNFRRAEPMQRVQWSVFLYHDNLSWMTKQKMLTMRVVVVEKILKTLLSKGEHSLRRDLCNSGCYPRHRHHHENQVYFFFTIVYNSTILFFDAFLNNTDNHCE